MPDDDLLAPSEVASMFGVSASTVALWADTGKLPFVRTLGGHRRFRRSDVEALVPHAAPSPEVSA